MEHFLIKLIKLLMLIVPIVCLFAMPPFISKHYDLDDNLDSLSYTRYDEKRKISLKNDIYKAIVIMLITTFVFTLMLFAIIIWMVMI